MTESVELELGIEECYPDYAGNREPEIPAPDERDETDEMIISMTIDEKKHEFLREQAEERLNVENIEREERLLWIDEAEVYSWLLDTQLLLPAQT